MMLSSWAMNPIWESLAACPKNTSVTNKPSAIRTMCCFKLPPPGQLAARPESALDEKFHLDPGDLDDVVIVQGMRLRVDGLAVDYGEARSFDVGDEIPLRSARDDGDLNAGLAEGRERLGQFQLLAGIGAGE